MNLYEACVYLDIWHIAKARAEVWSMSRPIHDTSLVDLKLISKSKFKELALVHHPDRGGDNSECLKLQEAYEIIKNSSTSDFISALDLEVKYYESGSIHCCDCSKWSPIINSCITSSCTGFKLHKKVKHKIGNFFSRKSQISSLEI